MAVTSTPFNRYRYLVGEGVVDFSNDVHKAVLVPVGFSQAIDTQSTLADLTAGNAPISANLSTSAVTLANPTFTESDSLDRAVFTSDMVEFVATGAVSAIGMVVYNDTLTSPDTDPLATYVAFGETKTLASGEKLQITPPAGGWLQL